MLYHVIRDNIQELQRKNQISSIIGMKTVELLNGSCEIHDFCDQLDLLESDEEIQAQDAKKICYLLLEQVSTSGMYRCFRDTGSIEPIEFGEIYNATIDPQEASIYTETHQWEPCDQGGWVSVGDSGHDPIKDPTEILFHVNSESFVLIHKDKTRSPWVQNWGRE
jgi:hypothetical protein